MRIEISKILQIPTSELWNILDGQFTIIFPDGELETDAGHTNYSSYAWDLAREFPHIQVYKRNHLTHILKNRLLTRSTNMQLIGNLVWRIYSFYKDKPDLYEPIIGFKANRQEFKSYLAHRSFQIVNQIYNELTYRLEEYVVTLKIEDFIDVLDYPEINEVISINDPTEGHIQDVYNTVEEALIHAPNKYDESGKVGNKPSGYDNVISRLVRSELIDANQLNQCVGVRGFITDIDSSQFPIPITRNLTNGIRKFYDSLIESRSASKSLAFATQPLQNTEYFNRRLQLQTLNLLHLDQGDCGSTNYLPWKVRDNDLRLLVGKYYMDDDGKLKVIRKDHTHLIGRTLNLRTVAGCKSKNPQGVCETCFGELSFAIFDQTNLGWACSTNLCQIISQSVLSVKHLDGSSVIDTIEIVGEADKYFRPNKNGDGYLMSPDLKFKNTRLIIKSEGAPGFTDIMDIDDIYKLAPSRVTYFDQVRIDTLNDKGDVIDQAVLNVGMVRRKASFTMEMISYIRDNGWTYDNNNNIVINLSKWNHRDVIMTIPHRHFNMSDLSNQIQELVEGRAVVKKIKNRYNDLKWEAFVMEFYDLVNSRLKVNLAIIEVIAYCIMMVSYEENDYSLPKPWTQSGFGIKSKLIPMRSESALMAYEKQIESLINPVSFNYRNRLDHPLDVFLTPEEVISEYNKRGKINPLVRS